MSKRLRLEIQDDDGSTLGKYSTRPGGKPVSEVLKYLEGGPRGVLFDEEETALTDSDLLLPERIYTFRAFKPTHFSSGGISKRQRTLIWKKSEEKFPALSYTVTSSTFRIPLQYFEGTGLETPKTEVLYCRDMFCKQFAFLEDKVIHDSCIGIILGSPGTGKSVTTYAFASTLDRRRWNVLWAHVGGHNAKIQRSEGSSKWTVETAQEGELMDILMGLDTTKPYILIVDGYLPDDHKKLFKLCVWWVKDDTRHRLVFVTSVFRKDKSSADNNVNNVAQFFVDSWTIDEYYSAAAESEFFEQVLGTLDSTFPAVEDEVVEQEAPLPDDLVKSKYYFSGGNCRWMFQYQTERVINDINDLTEMLSRQVYPRQVLNPCYSCKFFNGKVRRSIVSRYALSQLAILIGPVRIKELAYTMNVDRDPLIGAWFLESWFFASIASGGIKLKQVGAGHVRWDGGRVEEFDPPIVPDIAADSALWLKPKKWSKGCYQTVYINKMCKFVRFVQVLVQGVEFFSNRSFVRSILQQIDKPHHVEYCALVPEKYLYKYRLLPDRRIRMGLYGLESGLPCQ